MFPTYFLYFTAIAWFCYGIYCFFQPQMLASAAGIGALNAAGVTELRAMYGGLQSGIGILALIGARALRWQRGVLLSLACVYGGLATARGIAALGGGDFSAYTLGAFLFEAVSCLVMILLFRRAAG